MRQIMRKIILYGDSILGGYIDHHLTPIVTDALKNHFPGDEFINVSQAGMDTDLAIENVNQRVIAQAPDLVILSFGVNDASISQGISAGKYKHNLQVLIEKIGAEKIILLSPTYTNAKIALDQSWPIIIQFGLIVEHLSEIFPVTFCNMTKIMNDQSDPNSLLQDDGIHLNQFGYEIFNKNLVETLKKI